MGMHKSPGRRARESRGRRAQDRAAAAKAGDVAVSRLLSRSDGPCWFCLVPIRVGDPIALYVENAQDKWWGHAECVASAKQQAKPP